MENIEEATERVENGVKINKPISTHTLAKKRRLERATGRPPALLEKNKAYARRLSTNHRRLFEKVMSGQSSSTEAIKAMCQSCFGYELVVEGIKDCQAYNCPLWLFRPYQENGNDEILQDS